MSMYVNQPMGSKAGLFKQKGKNIVEAWVCCLTVYELPATEESTNRKQARAVQPIVGGREA